MISVPTVGEEFSKIIEHLSKAQEAAAMICHLERDNDALKAQGWLAVSEMLKLLKMKVTDLARGRMQ